MRETAEDIASRIRSAPAAGSSFRIAGAATWLDAGAPCPAQAMLSLAGTSGIVEYEPGDLTITVGAGTPLAEVARTTAAEGQWLTLDPHGSGSMTLGAVVATGSSGPLSHAFGTPRDHVLGCEFVTGAGDVVRAGGRVVKNVAGFDLVRLVTGAWGTLGAITEVTLRLRALPEVDQTFTVGLSGSATSIDQAWHWLRHGEFTPLAAELLSSSLASRLGIGTDSVMLVRLGGNASFVRAAERALSTMGDVALSESTLWTDLQTVDEATSASLRLSALPSRISALWVRAAEHAERAGGHAHATVSRGVVRCVLPLAAARALRELMALGHENGISCIGERLPPDLWPDLHRRDGGSTLAALTTRVKSAFDPGNLLNPGILGGSR